MSLKHSNEHSKRRRCHPKKLTRVVTIANSLAQSQNGNYFVGQTPELSMSKSTAYGALFNPEGSEVDLFVNVFTITNFSDIPLKAEIWIDSTPPGIWLESDLVTTTNTSITPTPTSMVELIYLENSAAITTGVNAFDRVIPGKSTIVAEEDGKYIVPPKKFFVISLTPTLTGPVTASIAYGWFTRKREDCKK